MKLPTVREVGEVVRMLLVAFAALAIVAAAQPVAVAIGGGLGILAGFGLIILGLLVAQFV